MRSTASLVLAALLLYIHIIDATYSCCSKERRGKVCTLAGNGDSSAKDSPNASTAAVYSPHSVVLYPPNSIVVAGSDEHRLRIIHGNGSVSTLAGGGPTGTNAGSYEDSDDPLAARFWWPAGICADNGGSVVMCDHSNHRIRTILRNGSVRTLAGSGAGALFDNADPLKAQFYRPHGIASIVENGQRLIIIGGNYDHRVRVIYANMTVSTLAGSGGIGNLNCDFTDFVDNADPLRAKLCHPDGVATDGFGNIVLAEYWGHRIRKLWRDGSQSGVTTIAGKGPTGSDGSLIDSDNPLGASIFTPLGVAIDSAGNILVTTQAEHRVRVILVNGSVRTFAGSGPSTGISQSTPGGFKDNVPLLRAGFNHPVYMAIDRDGNVVFADRDNNRVRMLCIELRTTLSPSPTFSGSGFRHRTKGSLSIGYSASQSQPSAQTIASNTTTWTVSHEYGPKSSATHSLSQTRSLRLLPQPVPNPISRLVSSEEAARAVVASGAAAAALAGFAATASMGHATRMGALMRSVECAFASGELDPPSLVELPLQWSVESQGGSVGSHAGSALLTSAVLVVLPLLSCTFVHAILSSCGVSERPVLRSLQRSVLSRYCLLSMAFFAPNVLMSSVVVVGHGASSGAVLAAIFAAIVPLLLGCVAGQRALAMDVEVVPLSGGKWELRNRPSSRAYVETFGGLVSGCRDPTPYIVRVCFLEDAAASLVLSFLSGVSLSTARCEWVALAMLVVSALHLLYVVCVRPLRSALESAMNCCLCGVQVLMAALCLAIASGADNSGGVLMSVLGVVAVVQNASFFVQAAILAACACVSESRKKHAALSGAGPSGDTSMMMPMSDRALLSAPEAKQPLSPSSRQAPLLVESLNATS